jgi:Rrf2 family protein
MLQPCIAGISFIWAACAPISSRSANKLLFAPYYVILVLNHWGYWEIGLAVRLSTRVRYGVRALIELAKHGRDKPVPLHELAKNQSLSIKYLEQMASSLKIAGLIESVRGPEGGYRLTKKPSELTVWDIYRVLDVDVDITDCLKDVPGCCPREQICVARELWLEVNDTLKRILKSKTLQQLADREIELQRKKPRPRRKH